MTTKDALDMLKQYLPWICALICLVVALLLGLKPPSVQTLMNTVAVPAPYAVHVHDTVVIRAKAQIRMDTPAPLTDNSQAPDSNRTAVPAQIVTVSTESIADLDTLTRVPLGEDAWLDMFIHAQYHYATQAYDITLIPDSLHVPCPETPEQSYTWQWIERGLSAVAVLLVAVLKLK